MQCAIAAQGWRCLPRAVRWLRDRGERHGGGAPGALLWRGRLSRVPGRGGGHQGAGHRVPSRLQRQVHRARVGLPGAARQGDSHLHPALTPFLVFMLYAVLGLGPQYF